MNPPSNESLLSWLKDISYKLANVCPNSYVLHKMEELRADIEQDYYTIVTVGEFKHGKSTLINALLGDRVLPADVTPTTATINALFYSQEKEVLVIRSSGEMEKYPLSSDLLYRYTATADFDPEDIKYLKIYYPSPLLHHRTVLVDTPGVNDLNAHRAEITHRFIPRADVIIMVLDMTGPVRKTEQQFLEETLLRYGKDHILFVANFADRVEDDEYAETLEHIQRRISTITGLKSPPVFGVSALEALQAKLEGNEERVRLSGISELEKAIGDYISGSVRMVRKKTQYLRRLRFLIEEAESELEIEVSLGSERLEVLREQLQTIDSWYSNKPQWERQILDYVSQNEAEINFMVQKSFQYFAERVREETQERIHHFHGPDLKHLTESQLPLFIRSQFTQWTEQYGLSIHYLFDKFEQELTRSLSTMFQESVQIRVYQSGRIVIDTTQPVATISGANSNVKAGLVVGGMSAAALLLGGTFLIPIIGMAGLPFIQQKVAEKQLENAKPILLAAADEQLDMLFEQGRMMLSTYVSTSVQQIREKALSEFLRLLESRKHKVDRQIQDQGHSKGEHLNRLKDLQSVREEMTMYRENVANEEEMLTL